MVREEGVSEDPERGRKRVRAKYLKHREVGAGEGAEVVVVALTIEVAREDGKDGHDDAHDDEGVGHCGVRDDGVRRRFGGCNDQ